MDKFKDTVGDLRVKFQGALKDENTTQEEQLEIMEAYYNAISEEKAEQVRNEYEELKNVTDNNILASRGIHVLTASEAKYYNEVEKTGKFPADELLPETVIERVFDDIQQDRPLLKLIRFTPGVGRQKVITSKRFGKAVWGPLHRDLEGQLDMTFDATETELRSLTAFFLISNDTLDLGPRWIDRYIRLCLQEAISEAWEEAIVAGTGNNEPIGLLKDLDGAVVSGVYPDKASTGTLTFADATTMVKELGGILKDLSSYTVKYTDLAGDEKTQVKNRKVAGKVNLLINPANYYDIVTKVTTQNANGVFVSNFPFIPQDRIIESEFVPEGKLVAFLDGEYDAQAAYQNRIYVYKETFAMNRATLYAIDVFGDGRPTNNDSAKVYDIAIPVEEDTETP